MSEALKPLRANFMGKCEVVALRGKFPLMLEIVGASHKKNTGGTFLKICRESASLFIYLLGSGYRREGQHLMPQINWW